MLSGNVSISASSNKVTHINYPTELNINNCVPIACGINVKGSIQGNNYVGSFHDALDLSLNALTRTLTLKTDEIVLNINNAMTSSKTYEYKIVLMKII